jgi:hypothetical protein
MESGALKKSVPPTMSGAALKLPMMGDWLSRLRCGSRRLSSANTLWASEVHSAPPGMVIVSTPSGAGLRQATCSTRSPGA